MCEMTVSIIKVNNYLFVSWARKRPVSYKWWHHLCIRPACRWQHFIGERGDFWQASHYSYQNSLTKIKMKGHLSRDITEDLGVKQGRNKSSDHYKIYIAPLLDTLDSANLGVWVGPVNVSVSGVADDVYLYGRMYRIEYGALK